MAQQRRAIQISFESLARVDGSARFAFGRTAALASVSGPIEARLSAENPSHATFDVHLRPLSGVPATDARSLSSSVRSALLPSLILTHNPRTLIQLVLLPLSSPSHSQSYCWQRSQNDLMSPSGGGISSDHALAAALVNASTLALLNAGSVPMRGIVTAVSVGLLASTGDLIVDPNDDHLSDLAASGCFAFFFADGDVHCVWTSWKIIPNNPKNTRRVKEDDFRQARELASTTTKEIRDEMKRSIIHMGKKKQIRIPPTPVKQNAAQNRPIEMHVDDDKMEI